jgi:hypothetical protein
MKASEKFNLCYTTYYPHIHFGNNQRLKDEEDLHRKPSPFPCTETTATLLSPKRGSELVSILLRNFERGRVSISLSLSA